jgi:hypothetical protein
VQLPSGWQAECVGQALAVHGTPKFEAPQTAPQGPQSSGQLAHVSPCPGAQRPSPQVGVDVHVEQVVWTPNIHTWTASPPGE